MLAYKLSAEVAAKPGIQSYPEVPMDMVSNPY